jgi:hypothetical protein
LWRYDQENKGSTEKKKLGMKRTRVGGASVVKRQKLAAKGRFGNAAKRMMGRESRSWVFVLKTTSRFYLLCRKLQNLQGRIRNKGAGTVLLLLFS